MKNKWIKTLGMLVIATLCLRADDCDGVPTAQPQSNSGITQTKVSVPTGTDGLTTEQRNVRDRLVIDNKPGAIKHLYVISAYSGQVLIYSTVRGKVTSSGKRLTPTTVLASDSANAPAHGIVTQIGNDRYLTPEVLQDDGTYGSSIEYLYWWDARGVYHQHYVQGGQIVHISDQPIAVKGVVLNLSSADEK